MSSSTVTRPRAAVAARTLRRDAWWLEPLITVVVLGGFVVYGTWTALVGRDYFVDPYLSPFYSPCLAANCVRPTWQIVGNWWKVSPALLVLPFPLAFRLTCYYYRKAYYRSFWWAPPACAVPDARARYSGETRFPLILQNVGMGLGTLILLLNATLLWLYTLSCHSCRHLCGGMIDQFSRAPLRFWLWRRVSVLNARHMLLAWVSLVVVALTDLYVRLVATGTVHDLRFF